jgi:thiosulfate/3-mercaptopyruvate sulfurtransferase
MAHDPVITVAELSADPGSSVFDCRPDSAAYRAGHLAGARHAQLERDLSASASDPADGGRHPLPDVQDFARRLGAWGVTPASRLVAYDDQNGANAAARFWWMLRALGHEQVQVLEGGVAALRAAGLGFTSEEPPLLDAPPYPARAFAWPLADIDEVERARAAADRRVIDVRASVRFRGESEPIDPIAGHIPGARNLPLTDNLRADGTFKSAEELRALYAGALGGVAPERAIIHCGSGVTACHTLLALERAGMHGAKLYVGSWSEWCRRPEREREPAG